MSNVPLKEVKDSIEKLAQLHFDLRGQCDGGAFKQLDDLRAAYQRLLTEPTPFSVEWYKLHRQHEIELNRATLQYEHERLKFLAYLNGGAIGVSLTLLGSAKAGDSKLQDLLMTPLLVAVFFWTLGLVAAWFAWSLAHVSQSYYTTAYRMRRYGYEDPLAATSYDFGSTQSLPPYDKPSKSSTEPGKSKELNCTRLLWLIMGCQDENRDVVGPKKAGDLWRDQAGFLQRKWQCWSSISLGMFALGALFLVGLMGFAFQKSGGGADGPSAAGAGASQASAPSAGSPNTPTQAGPAGASGATSAATGEGSQGSPPTSQPQVGASGAAGSGQRAGQEPR